MKNRFEACMLLAAIGDSIGYKRGHWQFNKDGPSIHREMLELTNGEGVLKLEVNKRNFPYSDDTVMHFATARGLLESQSTDSLGTVCQNVAKHYKACWKQMPGRAAGMTCKRAVDALYYDGSNWDSWKFEKNGGGCGASMRSACIGLVFSENIRKLVEVSIETGRITHHNPLGYLGGVVSAYFTALAIRGQDPSHWLQLLFKEALPQAKKYVAKNREAQDNLNGGDWRKFQDCWKFYAEKRKMSLEEPSNAQFPSKYGVEEREEFYESMSLNGWPGALGVDSVIIAYDALLYSKDNWEQLCLSSMLHGGDSDSTGTIAAGWFGSLYGLKGVPEIHVEKQEGKDQAISLGGKLFDQFFKEQK